MPDLDFEIEKEEAELPSIDTAFYSVEDSLLSPRTKNLVKVAAAAAVKQEAFLKQWFSDEKGDRRRGPVSRPPSAAAAAAAATKTNKSQGLPHGEFFTRDNVSQEARGFLSYFYISINIKILLLALVKILSCITRLRTRKKHGALKPKIMKFPA